MFTASPAEIVVVGLALGSVVAWLDSLTNPPKPDEETAWGRVPVTVKAKETLALPAPSLVLAQPVPVIQQENVAVEQPAPKLAAAAMKSSAASASKSAPKGKGIQSPKVG